MRTIVMLTTVGIENRPMGEAEPDSVDFFKDWSWVTASVVGVSILVALNEVLGITVNDWVKNIFVIDTFYIFIVLLQTTSIC